MNTDGSGAVSRASLTMSTSRVTSYLGIIVSGSLHLLPADVIVAGLICYVCIGVITLLAARQGYLS